MAAPKIHLHTSDVTLTRWGTGYLTACGMVIRWWTVTTNRTARVDCKLCQRTWIFKAAVARKRRRKR